MKNCYRILFLIFYVLLTFNSIAQVMKPGPTNTGYSGTLTPASVGKITVDGTVIENVSTGAIKVQANNVTIRNCLVDGGLYGINCDQGDYTGILIEDCEIINSKSAGIIGSNFTARRCNIHEIENDAFKPRFNVLIENCWTHHLGKVEGSHADAVQMVNGDNTIIRGNFFEGPVIPGTNNSIEGVYKFNAALMVADNPAIDVLFENNWVDGGNYCVNFSGEKGCPVVTVINNHFSGQYNYGVISTHGCEVTFTGNIEDPELTSTIPEDASVTGASVNVKGINISSATLKMEMSNSSVLDYSLIPSDASNQNVIWSSSDTSVATVEQNGMVTAVNEGVANITATTVDGGFSASCAVSVTAVVPYAGGFYCDPVNGSMANDGTQSSPWSSLQDVFDAGKTFADGETVYLMNGNHGFPVISEKNNSSVTITKAAGHNPVIQRISFNGASYWLLKDIEVSTDGLQVPTTPPLVHPVYPIIENSLVQISNNSSYITISDCYINSINNSANWTADDWNYKAWTGIYHTNTNHITVKNCLISNVNFGIHNTNGTTVANTLYEYNTIENFTGDGLRGHGTNTVIQYNTVKNCYATNGNHRDMIQVVGTTTGLILRGNKFIAYTDPNQPFKTGCQGIALFNGMYYDILIENNVVFTDHYNGITILGAQNCKIVNNTVIDMNNNNLWIQIGKDPDGAQSTGNTVSNNLCSNMNNEANIGTIENNIIISYSNYDTYFKDYKNCDFSLKAGCNAIDAGTETEAPSFDIDKISRPHGAGIDVGAYEFNSEVVNEANVTVFPSSINLVTGNMKILSATIEPSNATYKTVTWSSENPSVATVNPTTGVVTAVAKGTAKITAATNNLGLTSTCTVTVTENNNSYLINENFSSGASNFTEIAGGQWTVSNEQYVLSNPGSAGTGLLGNISVHNIVISGDFELGTLINITSTTSAWNDVAVIFNFQDADNYYYVSLNESNDGNTKGIFKVVNSVVTELADITAAIIENKDYNIEIVKSGFDIVVKLDGNQIAWASDATFTEGKVGYESKNDGGRFDNLVVSGRGSSDIETTSISLLDNNENIIVYPNPCENNVLNIKGLDISKVSTVNMYNYAGKLIKSDQIAGNNDINSILINTDKLNNGLYIITIINRNKIYTEKIIINK